MFLQVMKSKEIPFEKEIHEEVANAFLALDPDSLEPGLSAVAKDLVDLWEDEGTLFPELSESSLVYLQTLRWTKIDLT